MSFELTKLTASILLTEKIPLFAHTVESMYPAILLTHPYNLFNYDLGYASSLSLKSKNSINRLFLFVCNRTQNCYEPNPSDPYVKEIDKHKQSKTVCYKERYVNLSNPVDVNDTIKLVNRERKSVILQLAGDYLSLHRGWELFNVTGNKIAYIASLKDDADKYCKIAHKTYPNFYKLTNCTEYKDNMDFYYSYHFIHYINDLFWCLYWNSPLHCVNKYHKTKINDIGNETCPIPICTQGKEIYYGPYTIAGWKYSFGWHCRKCLGNSVKATSGNHSCKKCSSLMKSNKFHTRCHDPYTDYYIRYNSNEGLVILSFTLLLVFIIMFFQCLLLINRKTPIVLACDLRLTSLQLLSQLVLLTLLPVLFIGKTGNISCMSRPIVIGLFLNLWTALSLTKTQKFLLIFQASVKFTHKEVLITKASEIFGIFGLLAISGGLVIVSNYVDKAEAHVTTLAANFMREYTCNTNWHILLQFAYMAVLQIVCGIQAYRARKLPESFKETAFLTLASFVSTLIIAVLSLIYFSQPSPFWQSYTIVLVTLLILLVNVVCLYGYKAFLILLRPDMNVKSVVINQIRMKMTKRSEELFIVLK
ncbi:extracellular calcium-sensing receptor-like [Hydractinia symbiolongicarpus]|uniref:extracellular calcium-sensing receptor-like n=1 Tax=Hydractinia symbiolongicarpus TaxID=13093 RepID=UPI00254A10D5|nr:extracellular calcium-sensing receptor-like [Hydractinia symbiolongicarpus]